MIKIAFSWDDGAVEDMKLAKLSEKYNIPGMFFIPQSNPERAVIGTNEITDLLKLGFEVGAHTKSHHYLTEIDKNKIFDEIKIGKNYLEEVTGKQIKHFCLPGGRYNNYILDISRQLFQTTRTADTCAVTFDKFLVKPTFHFCNRGIKSLIFNSLKNDFRILKYILKNKKLTYFDLLKGFIDYSESTEEDLYIMFWGHSWEIEQFGLWKELEYLFLHLQANHASKLSSYENFVNI